jgi:hypothetical protein
MKEAIELTKQIMDEAQELVQSHVTNAEGHVLMEVAMILALAKLTTTMERRMRGIELSIDMK